MDRPWLRSPSEKPPAWPPEPTSTISPPPTVPVRAAAVRSPEEVEEYLKKNFLEPLAQLKARIKPEDLEKELAGGYNRMTGNKLERMSEPDFLAWARTVAEARFRPPRLKTIVNPVSLIEALDRR
jgi:hypothetical protein